MILINSTLAFLLCVFFANTILSDLRNTLRWEDRMSRICWFLGIAFCGLSMLSTCICELFGYSAFFAKTIYITGPILGFIPLGLSFIFIFCDRRLSAFTSLFFALISLLLIIAVILSPYAYKFSSSERIVGLSLEWKWIRSIMSFINLASLLFFIGGAGYSIFKFTRRSLNDPKFNGYLLLILGTLLPSVDGMLMHTSFDIFLGLFEFLGILFLFFGYYSVYWQHSEDY